MARMLRFRVGKLIRDRLVAMMRADGLTTFERALPLPEFQAALAAKLVEEAHEAASAGSRAELIEELADVAEVLLALTAAHGIDAAEVEAARLAKRASRGGFDARIWNEAVAAPEGAPALDYYLTRPQLYPQETEA